MAAVITLVLVVACVFLFRSMLAHVRQVPPSFDAVETDSDVTETPGR